VRLRITLEDGSYEVGVEILPEPQAGEAEDPRLDVMPESVLKPPHPVDTRPQDKICRSPIAGMVVSVHVLPGQFIRRDEPMITIEAMKMQNIVGAPMDGAVEEVLVKAGEIVKTSQVLCTLA
jgi:biotin carboxyl carrier protein